MKISDNVNVKGINYVDTSLYFFDSSVSVYRDAANNLVFDDAFNSPKTLSEVIAGTGGVTLAYVDASLNKKYDIITTGLVVDGGTSILTTGSKGYKKIGQDCRVTGWNIIGTPSGSIVIDVKRCVDSAFPTTSSIAGTEKPTLSGQTKNNDTNLTTWTTDLSAGDILEYNIDSASTITKVWLTLLLNKI